MWHCRKKAKVHSSNLFLGLVNVRNNSHVAVLVGDDLGALRHLNRLPLEEGALDGLRVDVGDHRLVVVASQLLWQSKKMKSRVRKQGNIFPRTIKTGLT